MAAKKRKVTPFEWIAEDGTRYEVPCWMVTDSDGKVTFETESDENGIDRTRNSDVNELRKAVVAILAKNHDLVWEPYLYIHTERTTGYSGNSGAGLRIEWSYYQVATRKDGTRVCFKSDGPEDLRGRSTDFYEGGRSRHRELPKVGDSVPGWARGEAMDTYALVPATPENIAAVQAFKTGVERMADKIRAVFHPVNIERTLLAAPRMFAPALKAAPETK